MNVIHDDVVIVGGGAIGLCIALALLERGRSVRILEAESVGGATSHGNCGTITPSHVPPLASWSALVQGIRWLFKPEAPFYIKPRFDPALWYWLLRFAFQCRHQAWQASAQARAALLCDSRFRLAEWVQRYRLDCEFTENGLDYVFRDAGNFEHHVDECRILDEMGIPTQVIDGRDYQCHEPALKPGLSGAIRFPMDAQLRPDRYTAELARVIRAHGGQIEEYSPVQGLVVDEGKVAVATATGKHQANAVVVAAAAWSPTFVKKLGIRLPIQPGKGYSISYSRPVRVPTRPLVLKDRLVFVTSWSDGFRLGSTMEFSGFDTQLNELRLSMLERAAEEYLLEPHGVEVRERWYGWRPMIWDDLPVLGRSPFHSNLWIAAGHGMLGMSMSAGSGQLMADLIAAQEPSIDPGPYRVERFGRL